MASHVLCQVGNLCGSRYGVCSNDRASVKMLNQCIKPTPYKNDGKPVSEGQLIGSRVGLFEPKDWAMATVCADHRARCGLSWTRSRSKLCYNEQCGRKFRTPISYSLSMRVKKTLGKLIATGEEFCQECLKNLRDKVEAEETKKRKEGEERNKLEQSVQCGSYDLRQESSRSLQPIADQMGALAIDEAGSSSSSGSSFKPTETPSLQRSRKHIADTFLSLLGEAEVLRTLKPTFEWSATSKASKSLALISLARIVKAGCSVIAPGKEAEVTTKHMLQIWEELKGSGHVEKVLNIQPVPPATTRAILSSYHFLNDKRSRRVLLSTLAGQMSFAQMQSVLPTVTQYEFKMAQTHAHTYGPGRIVQPTRLYRVEATKHQAYHFVDFLFDHGVLLDKAWASSKNIKLSTGEKRQLIEAITSANFQSIIQRYKSYCLDVNYTPLGRTSLFDILHKLPLTRTEAIQCMDMRVAEGKEAMTTLQRIISNLPIDEDDKLNLKTRLRVLEDHIQTELKPELSLNNECLEHCITFALSELGRPEFSNKCTDHSHLYHCEKCLLIAKLKETILTFLASDDFCASDEEKEDLIADVDEAMEKLDNWRAHQVRAVNQNRARSDVSTSWLKERPLSRVYIHQDFAQKVLPQKYYEGQQEYYGKTGISWHTAVATVCLENGSFETTTLVHILDNHVKQSSALVSVIDLHLIKSLKKQYPTLSEAIFGSDCAHNYLSANTLLSLTKLKKKTRVEVKAYHFTEPQAGKSMCDRMTAVLKNHARTYLNEGNNISTGEELYKALTHKGGVQGCGVALVSFEEPKDTKQKEKINNISQLRNFSFENDCIISQRAYGMGVGQVTKLSTFKKMPEFSPLGVIYDFDDAGIRRTNQASSTASRPARPIPIEEDEEQDLASHECSECDKSFRRYRDLLAHEAAGNHKSMKMSTKPLQDHLLEYYQEKYESTQFTIKEHRDFLLQEITADIPTTPDMIDKQSWALPKPVTRKRYTESVRKFLLDQLEKGKGKADPVKVAAAMVLDHRFKRSDRLSYRQIKAYYSVIKSRKLRNQPVEDPVEEEEIAIEYHEKSKRGQLKEKYRLLSNINDLISLNHVSLNHPIMYEGTNLCTFSDGKWKNQTKTILTDVAESLEIPVKSHFTYQNLLKAIKEKLSTCSCRIAGTSTA